MAEIVPIKRGFPLNNPLPEKALLPTAYPCKYCSWVGGSRIALDYHLNHFHEQQLAKEGEEVRKGTDDTWGRNNRWLLARGYVKCPWWTVPCATKTNPLMARVCKHLNDCPS